jgi:hypothetical protein
MKKKTNHIKKTVRFILFLIILILSIKVVSLSFESYRSSIWQNQKSNLFLDIKGKDHLLAEINSSQKTIFVIKIGADSIPNSPNELFGVKCDGYVENPNLTLSAFDIKLGDVVNRKTDISIFDYLKIKLLNLRFEKIDLSKEVKNEISHINSQTIRRYSSNDIDKYFNKIFPDQYLAGLKFYVKIDYSGKDTSKFEYYKRLVENIGWKLSDYSENESRDNKQNVCLVKKENKNSNLIMKIFDCQLKVSPSIDYDLEIKI